MIFFFSRILGEFELKVLIVLVAWYLVVGAGS